MTAPQVLLTGATGYVGGRLLPRLEARGARVRCLVRSAAKLGDRAGPRTEVVVGDAADRGALRRALRGVDVAYYLLHSMDGAGDFEKRDRRMARRFGEEAARAGVRRIVYLGGLGGGSDLSPHLRSRHEVGALLGSAGVPVVEFRAAVLLGAGSLSFEMIRALVERLPVMVTPRWVRVPTQPLAVRDALAYLEAAVDAPEDVRGVVELGGRDVVSYGDLMRAYARERGLRRWLVPVPFLTAWLSSLWLALVTPLYARVGRRLIGSLRHPTVVRDPGPAARFRVAPLGHREAIREALRSEEESFRRRPLADLAPAAAGKVLGRRGNRWYEERGAHAEAPPGAAFGPLRRLGGDDGWPYADPVWRLRHALDRALGGPGARGRGQRLAVGEVVDSWRVEALEEGRRLRLRSEMRLPGRAWLEFEVEPERDGSRLRQTAVFEPRGLGGLLYWFLTLPVHRLMFRGMLRSWVRSAERDGARGTVS